MTRPLNRLRWISLSKVDTGNVFSVTHSIDGSQWPWIAECVATEFDCSPDDLHSTEGDDGREFVTLNGEPLVEIHNERLTGNVAGLAEVRAA